MQIWQIILICILLLPIFYIANYFVVKRMVASKRAREEKIDRAVAESVARSYSTKGPDRYRTWPKYNAKRRR